ncbi:MAG: four helix bundle protein [Chitinophagaceae bacterium]|nr:four helix bundle protein [Chitinophagaceae bacterium]MBL0130602.1 four helix bundle protein [Chitinophagaceae bacterium]MBL0274305.1 four helix bundle protein [Chitinophagaceae bacterium]
MNAVELQKRLKEFAYRIVPLCESLPAKKISRVIEGQLMRSAFSAAANYRAACKAQSAKAFASKLSIAFEEIDESLFWLETIADLMLIQVDKLSLLLKEADELTRILASSRKTSQTKLKAQNIKS